MVMRNLLVETPVPKMFGSTVGVSGKWIFICNKSKQHFLSFVKKEF